MSRGTAQSPPAFGLLTLDSIALGLREPLPQPHACRSKAPLAQQPLCVVNEHITERRQRPRLVRGYAGVSESAVRQPALATTVPAGTGTANAIVVDRGAPLHVTIKHPGPIILPQRAKRPDVCRLAGSAFSLPTAPGARAVGLYARQCKVEYACSRRCKDQSAQQTNSTMPKVTLLARLTDGLPLAASMADEKDAYAGEVRDLSRTRRISASRESNYAATRPCELKYGTRRCELTPPVLLFPRFLPCHSCAFRDIARAWCGIRSCCVRGRRSHGYREHRHPLQTISTSIAANDQNPRKIA